MRSLALAVGAALLALTALAPGVALAATTLVVDADGFATAANCNDAVTPAYTTIQAAVNAASGGDTIKVCPGTYNESVTVSIAWLTLVGPYVGHSAASCPNRLNTATVNGGPSNGFNLAADGVTIDGFRIGGSSAYGIETSPAFSGYRIRDNVIEDNAGGIYLNADGAILSRVRYNCLRDNNATFTDATPFPTAGTGIYTDQGLDNADIVNNGFRHHLNVAINLATTLSPATQTSNIRVGGNTSVNDTTFLAVYNADHVYVSGNRVSQNSSGQDWNGSAIYIGGGADIGGPGASAITLTNNRIVSTQLPNGFYAGIAVRGSAHDTVISYNTIKGTYNGISITSNAVGAAYVRGNAIWNAHNNGIEALAPTAQNVFTRNGAHGSANFDCFDSTTGSSTLGTANTWLRGGARRNVGDTSSPAGLCRKH